MKKCRFKVYCSECKHNDVCKNKSPNENAGCCQGIPGYPDSSGYCSAGGGLERQLKCMDMYIDHLEKKENKCLT